MRIERIEATPIYPYNEWEIIEEAFKPEHNYRNETIFSLGNGYIGMRGTFEEGYPGAAGMSLEGTYLNGFFESETIRYTEFGYGYPEKSQTMLNVTNGKVIMLYLDGEEFNMLTGEIAQYRRVLDLRQGFLRRSLIWTSPGGKTVKIDITRMISFNEKHLAAICYEVTPLNFKGKIKIFSALDGDVRNLPTGKDPRVGCGLTGRVLGIKSILATKEMEALVQQTKNTGFTLVTAMKNELAAGSRYTTEVVSDEAMIGRVFNIEGKTGKKIRLYKYLAYVSSRDYAEEILVGKAGEVLEKARQKGFAQLCRKQREYLDRFWYRTDVEIKGDIAIQQGIRFNIFHLLQAVGKDGKTNIGAKGLTGEGYEGHYFWDTEIYILPFFLYSTPRISRKLLEFRYHTLDKARKRAREIGHEQGALFPWRTIGGEECSTYFPAGTAQYHIDADIAYAVKRYMDATEDREFLLCYGAEILFETARLWMDIGKYIERKDNKFCIHGVTGPDEYTAIVNNNCYTNLMARENLQYAFETAVWMRKSAPEKYAELAAKINLSEEEVVSWQRAAENMYIPYDKKLRIFPQDDNFLDKPVWDLDKTPKEKFPLLMHYHPLLIYKHQVCKQPDLVLALLLLAHKFTREEKKRNYDYYERITAHDSSLSPCIFSTVASEIGYYEKAYSYFLSTVRMDLDDYHGNTKDGIHAACMAGAWVCVVFGFAGMRVFADVISFDPYLPKQWEEYSFKVTYRGRLIKITVNKTGTVYELLEGNELPIYHKKKKRVLKKGARLICVNPKRPLEFLGNGLPKREETHP